jgi:D-alanyl-D-alanine carboxypeptidase
MRSPPAPGRSRHRDRSTSAFQGGCHGCQARQHHLRLRRRAEAGGLLVGGAVTGTPAEKCITQNVIERAGLKDTELPAGPHVSGPHSRIYEAWFGMIDPPRDYSVYDMSWVGPAASLISTVADLNRFFGLLLAGEIVSQASLAQVQRTVPVISFEGKTIDYGLGLHRMEVPGHGTYWGHDGSVWGGGAISMTRADGQRQMSIAVNLQRWNTLDSAGRPQHHPIDDALPALFQLAMCGHDGDVPPAER